MYYSSIVRSTIVFCLVTFISCSDEQEIVRSSPVLKSYIETNGIATVRAEFERNTDETISRLTWQRQTPTLTQGADVFSYDANGNLTEMTRSITGLHDERVVYTYYDGKIGFSEHFVNGDRIAFMFYEYDEHGRLIHTEENIKVPGGFGHLRGDEVEYFYNAEGNLFQVKNYSFTESTAQLKLESVYTYSNFTAGINPLQPVDVLPNVVFQKNLSSKLTIESNGNTTEHTYTYKLRSDNYPAQRIESVNGSVKSTTTFEYL